MSAHRIELRPGARTALLDLDKPTRRQLQRAIDSLAGAPRPADAVELAGLPGALRINVGKHKVVYTADDRAITILVIDKAQPPATAGPSESVPTVSTATPGRDQGRPGNGDHGRWRLRQLTGVPVDWCAS